MSNRANLITKLHTALKKHYTPEPAQPTRPLLEHILYGSLLEDAPADLADEGMAKCEQMFHDWNEVRVTTVTELSQVLSRLPEPVKAARRLKGNLQGVFEEFYTFDLDHLKKENLGKAVNKFDKMPSMTPFVLSYSVQHGLGGHSIPVDYSAMVIMLATEIATQPEAATGKVPGLERAIPKSKGIEFASLLHQAAVALNKSTKDKTARTVLDAVSKGSSKRLDEWLVSRKAAKKRVAKRKADEKVAAVEAAKAAEKAAIAAQAAKEEAARLKAARASAKKQPAAAKPAPKSEVKKTVTPKKSATASAAKSATTKTSKASNKTAKAKKPAEKKETKKKATKKTAKKAPAKKAAAKKAPAKKAAAKKAPAKKAAAKKAPAKKAAKKKTTKSSSKSSKKSTNRKLTKRKPR